jgi:CBS domain-containing protein
MDFDDAREFVAAARYGLNAQFRWTRGRAVPARELVLKHLLPLAREGLRRQEIDAADIERYLGTLEERVKSGRTGAQWAFDSLSGMPRTTSPDERHRALASGITKRQFSAGPVHTWSLARLGADSDWRHSFRTVDQVMTRHVFTVHPEDVIDLAASLMEWEHIRRVPVEDDQGHLVGLLSQRDLLRLVTPGAKKDGRPVAVREVMKPNPVTVSPQTKTLEAIEIMRKYKVGCLPVVENGKLVGIVTEYDFVAIATKLLGEELRD